MVVGERANLPRDRLLESLSDRRWLAASLRLGAFRDRTGRDKLRSIGVDLDADGAESVNLVPPSPQGVPFDAARASAVARILATRLGGWRTVYLCGGRVARAFGVGGRVTGLFGRTLTVGDGKAVVLPHPSGLNHWWNDALSVRRLRRCLSLRGDQPSETVDRSRSGPTCTRVGSRSASLPPGSGSCATWRTPNRTAGRRSV